MEGIRCSLFALLLILPSISALPAILTPPQVHTAATGSAVVFQCGVADQGSRSVQWFFIEHHNMQISSNMELLSTDEDKYAILRMSINPVMQWNLQITDLTHEDGGQYVCQVSGVDSQRIVNHLIITDSGAVPTRPPFRPSPQNYTGCCKDAGVTNACLPLCSTSGLSDYSNPAFPQCLSQLSLILGCVADERSHVACCERRDIPHYCLDFCAAEIPSKLDDEHLRCVDYVPELLLCIEENQGLLPSVPEAVSASAFMPSSIMIKWRAPEENADTVTGYKVFFKATLNLKDPYRSSPLLEPTLFSYMVQDLIGLTEYALYVIAINPKGSSLKSAMMIVTTPSGHPVTPGGETMQACCEERHVSEPCQMRFCGTQSDVAMFNDETAFQCFVEIDKVFICMAGEVNHTECCVYRGLPRECLSLCSGTVTAAGFDNVHCYAPDIMQKVSSCMSENKDVISSAPRALSVGQVAYSSAQLTWRAPSVLPELVVRYELSLKVYGDGDSFFTGSYTGTMALLTRLNPGTMYEASITSVCKEGISLPSTAVVFMTNEYTGYVSTLRPTVSTPTPPNFQACCQNEGVSDDCLFLCSAGLDVSNIDINKALLCQSHIGKVLACVADGRDHTLCCQRRDVDESCHKFCAFDHDQALSYEFTLSDATCLISFSDIMECLTTNGAESAPSPPFGLVLLNKTTHTISLQWQKPLYHAESVIGYIFSLSWGPENDKEYRRKQVALQYSTILQNLLPNTLYRVEISAFTESLTSPAVVIEARTLPDDPVTPINVTIPFDVSECCEKWDTSAPCLPVCKGGPVSLSECTSDLAHIVQCAADGKDHSNCCARERVPSSCFSYCKGVPSASDVMSLLCLSFAQQILTCFRNADVLPSPPQRFHLMEKGTRHLTLDWMPPKDSTGAVIYSLYYKESRAESYHVIENVQNPYILNKLTPLTSYTLYIVAVTEYGVSLPSTAFSVDTAFEKTPSIIITQEPNTAHVTLSTDVTLTCSQEANPDLQDLTFHWMRGNIRREGVTYNIASTTKADTGIYTCVAERPQSSISYSKIWVLKVQYPLGVVVAKATVVAAVGDVHQPFLSCEFYGYPDDIVWFKDDQLVSRLPEAERYHISQLPREAEGVIETHLVIFPVKDVDFDSYTCSASNQYGTKNGTIVLYRRNSTPTPAPPVDPNPRPLNVTACCIENEVSQECMPVCSFDIDLRAIQFLPGGGLTCVPHLPAFITCASNGNDNGKCCLRGGVPQDCLSFCAGVVPQPFTNEYLRCLDHIETIVDCAEAGHDSLPGPPQMLSVLLKKGYIYARWSPPILNPQYVTYYEVSYKRFMDPPRTLQTTGASASITLKAIDSFTNYTIFVRAGNHHGLGRPSNTKQIATQEMRPSKPLQLKIAKMTSSLVTFSWSTPSEYAGAVLFYHVMYAPKDRISVMVVNRTRGTETYFSIYNFLGNTTYQAYITAVSSHFESEPSETLTFITPEIEVTNTDKQSSLSAGETAGLGIGIFLLIVLLVTAVAFGLMFYLRGRGCANHDRYKESVAFENPGYTNADGTREAQVSGLPEDPYSEVSGVKGNASAVMEEEGYTSLRDTGQSESNSNQSNAYATLQLANDPLPDTQLKQTLHFDDGVSGS